jgi:uncharacterized membrane protein
MKQKIKLRQLVLFVVILSLPAVPLNMALGATLGNIHGTVVDEVGNPIEGVRILAYLGTGSLEETKYTNENGYFRMNLGGTYSLVFEKTGYITLQQTVQVTQAPTDNPTNDVVKLGDITLESTLELSTSVLTRFTDPGSTLELSFQVANKGDETENVVFTINAPANWDAQIRDSLGVVENIQLSPGQQEFTLEIKVPENAEQSESIWILAEGSLITELEFIITPTEDIDHEVNIHSTYLAVSVEKNHDLVLPLRVINEGNDGRIIDLTGIAPLGWTMSLETQQGMEVHSIYLSAGASEELELKLEQPDPDGATVGEYEVQVQAETPSDVLLDSLTIEVSLKESTSMVEVISSLSDVTIEADSSIEFPLVVWNRGTTSTVVLLSVDGVPDTWDMVFRVNTENNNFVEVSSILVGADESKTLQFNVDPPNSVQTGEYDLTAIIESDNGFIKEIPLAIIVEGSYELDLEMSTLYTTSSIGGTVTYSGTVTNEGQTAVSTIYLYTELPRDWEATTNPIQIVSLEPMDSETFTIEVELPGDTTAGDYIIPTRAISDQLESDWHEVRITAQVSNTWGYLGLGLAAVAVIGAAFLYKRFKRR